MYTDEARERGRNGAFSSGERGGEVERAGTRPRHGEGVETARFRVEKEGGK